MSLSVQEIINKVAARKANQSAQQKQANQFKAFYLQNSKLNNNYYSKNKHNQSKGKPERHNKQQTQFSCLQQKNIQLNDHTKKLQQILKKKVKQLKKTQNQLKQTSNLKNELNKVIKKNNNLQLKIDKYRQIINKYNNNTSIQSSMQTNQSHQQINNTKNTLKSEQCKNLDSFQRICKDCKCKKQTNKSSLPQKQNIKPIKMNDNYCQTTFTQQIVYSQQIQSKQKDLAKLKQLIQGQERLLNQYIFNQENAENTNGFTSLRNNYEGKIIKTRASTRQKTKTKTINQLQYQNVYYQDLSQFLID